MGLCRSDPMASGSNAGDGAGNAPGHDAERGFPRAPGASLELNRLLGALSLALGGVAPTDAACPECAVDGAGVDIEVGVGLHHDLRAETWPVDRSVLLFVTQP
jgi:hypothetical protein